MQPCVVYAFVSACVWIPWTHPVGWRHLKQEMTHTQYNPQVQGIKNPEFLYRINLSADEPEGISFNHTHTQTHIHTPTAQVFPDPEAP